MSDSDSDDDLLNLEPSGLSQSSNTSESLAKKEKEEKLPSSPKDDEEAEDRNASQRGKWV